MLLSLYLPERIELKLLETEFVCSHIFVVSNEKRNFFLKENYKESNKMILQYYCLSLHGLNYILNVYALNYE